MKTAVNTQLPFKMWTTFQRSTDF